MNHIYRLVWNRAKRVMQVASELAGGGGGGGSSPRRAHRPHALAVACALALGGLAGSLAPGAMAAVKPGTGGQAGNGAKGGNSGAGGNGPMNYHFGEGTVASGAGGTGGGPGGGGDRGAPGTTTEYPGVFPGAVTGGAGEAGASYGGNSGGGGGGGTGVWIYGSGGVGFWGSVAGGSGGAGWSANDSAGGGGGGTGIYVDASGVSLDVPAGASVAGGAGGAGGGGSAFANGAGGGGGGSAVVFTSGGALNNRSSITGGTGGAGGAGSSTSGGGGGGGHGVVGAGMSITNTGSIAGGAGGAGGAATAWGSGGAGVMALGNTTIVNNGAISGGMNGDGVTRAAAIWFGGTGNTLVQDGFGIHGGIVLDAGATATISTGGLGTTLTDGVELGNGSALALEAPGAYLDVLGGISGAGALTISGAGAFTFDAVDVASFHSSAGSTVSFTGNVTTTGEQAYDGSGLLWSNVVFSSSGNGDISFIGDLLAADTSLTVNTGGTTRFGTVRGSGWGALNSVTTDAAGETELNGDVTTSGAQAYNDAVTLAADVVLTSTAGDAIGLPAGVDGAHALTIDTTGVTTLGVIGASQALASLATDAGGSTIFLGDITTTGDQLYGDAVTLAADATLASTGGGLIQFGSTVGGVHALDVRSSGTVAFGDDVSLAALTVDAGAFSSQALTISGDLSVASAGGIAQLAGAFLVGGAASFDAGASDINLLDAGNDFSGLVDLAGRNATLYDANVLGLGVLALSGNLSVESVGAMDLGRGSVDGDAFAYSEASLGQSGALEIGGVARLLARHGDLILTNAGNDFSTVSAFGTDIAITDANDLTALATYGEGHVTLSAGGMLTLTPDLSTLVAHAGYTVRGGTGITMNGIFSSGGEQLFDGHVALAGDTMLVGVPGDPFATRVELRDGVDGAYALMIMQSGNVAIGDIGTTTALTELGVQAYDFIAGAAHVDGPFSVTTTSTTGLGIAQGGAWTVAGDAILDAGTGGISLLSAGNDFQGTVDVTGGSVGIRDANDLDIVALDVAADGAISLAAGGVLTLPTGDIDTGTADLSLSSGGAFTTPGALSGHNVQLAANGLVIGNDITGASVSLSGGSGPVVQTGGSITANALGGGSATTGDIRLEAAGNSIGMLGGFEAGSFSLVNSIAMLIDGHSTIVGDMRLQGPSFTLGGSIDAGSTTLGPNTFLAIGNGTTVGTLAGDLAIDATSSVAFRHSDDVTYAGAISGSGSLYQQGAGAVVLDGDSSAFAGSTNVDGGTLVVGGVAGNGAVLGGDVAVSAAGALGGHGTIGGDVELFGAARLAPGNSIGTLAIAGDLTLHSGNVLDFEFGAPGASFSVPGTGDRIDVAGDVSIDDATLEVTDAGGMGPGLYTVMTWGGALTQANGGLSLGTVPAGQDLQLQFLGDRINLLNLGGLTFNFWNANGAATATQLGGGTGTWSATSRNWTDAVATATSAMNPQPGFAIFGGTAGTVTVDAGAGAVAASGLQFASDGYRLTGDTLTLVGDGSGAPVIRVGDGSAAGAAMTATIDNVIAGSDGLEKADAGTLVLTAANTYTGGTTISGGTLQVSSDASLGAGGAGITLDGGTLAASGAFATSRDIVLGSAGGGVSGDAAMTLDGAITGAGILHKSGSGVLTLSGAGNGFGGTSVEAGTLALSGAGVVTGSLALAGGAFDASQANADVAITGLSGTGTVALGDHALIVSGAGGAFDGVIADGGIGGGSGASLQVGAGTLTLGGANAYTGATTVASGATLALSGAGSIATTSRLQLDGAFDIAAAGGDVSLAALAGAGTIALGDRTLALTGAAGTFAGSIAGTGGLRLAGTGTQLLTGANTYTGTTAIGNAITLQVGAGGTSGAIVGDAIVDGVLAFDRSDTLVFGGALSGAGLLRQQGSGTLVLDGNSSAFAGSTNVDGGMLVVGGVAGNGAALGGDVRVAGTAALGGHGVIGGDVSLAAGARLAPGNSIGTLAIGGDLALGRGVVLDYEFGAPGAGFGVSGDGDRVDVGGNVSIDGATLDVTDAGGMGAGLYTVLAWGGTLTQSNGGLSLGATPADHDLQLQVLGDRINLLDITDLALTFWNANGAASATQLGGGSGTWTVSSPNWTDAVGTATASMTPQPGFAIFGGAPGTVTVDDGAGAVVASGLQFASDGYRIAGDTLTLVGDNGAAPVVRVGDGSAAGAGMTATIDSVVAGSDGLRKDDAGTLVLTGANTYAGGTTLAGGTLRVSSDAGLGAAGEGVVLDGGTLAADGTFVTDRDIVVEAGGGGLRNEGAMRIDGTLAGTGTLHKLGTGVLTLANAGNAVGMMVDAGTLLVGAEAGSAAALRGDVAVAAGAVLAGHGRIDGDVANAGIVAPGASLGTLTIGGDYTQAATGALQIEATAGGQSDRLVVEGAASLGGSMLVLAQAGDWRAQTDYTILTAGGGVTGHFGSASSSLVFLDPLLAYGANAVTLTLRRNDIDFASVARTPNQAGVAAAADALGWGNAVYEELTTLDAGSAAAAFDSLSGEIHASTRGALLGDARQLREALVQQLATTEAGDRPAAWLTGWGHWSRTDGDGNAAAVGGDGSGFAVGGDLPLGGRVRLGAMLGSGRLTIESDARTSQADVDSRHAGAYALVDAGVLRFQAGTVRSTHDVDSQRTAAFGDQRETLRGEADADTTQSYVDASHRFGFGRSVLAPFASVARVRVHGEAFDETGGAAALHVDAGANARTVTTLGTRWDWTSDSKTLRFWGTAAWTRASGDDGGSARQRFADGSTPFGVSGPALAGDAVALDLGLRWQASARATIDATWNGRFGDGERDQGARVSLRVGF